MYGIDHIEGLDAADLHKVSVLLDGVPEQVIGCSNWAGSYPYAPKATFRAAHNGSCLFLKFRVEEQYTMAKITEDNGEVWTDSCVEFFISPDDSGYYNFEFTCIGKALLGFRKERPHCVHGTPEIMESIKRFPSLGTTNFDEKAGDNRWELTVAIPVTALFRHNPESWSGLQARANVYKCGDRLSHPHYLSWQPIDTPTPDFHVERCFAPVRFK